LLSGDVDNDSTKVGAVDIGERVPRPRRGERLMTLARTTGDESREAEAETGKSVFQGGVGNEPRRDLGAEQAQEPLRAESARSAQRGAQGLGVSGVEPRETRSCVGGSGEAVRFLVDRPRQVGIGRMRRTSDASSSSVVAIRIEENYLADLAAKWRAVL